MRRNPARAEELKQSRQSKIDFVTEFSKQQNIYLSEHKKANNEVALRKVNDKISKLKLKKVLTCNLQDRLIVLQTDKDIQTEQEKLDGCYVVKTNVPKDILDTKTAHDRYKDLAKVEFAFRTMKTTLEKLRPIYVRKEKRTRGHVFVAMLAYMIVKYITDSISELNYTRVFAIESLDKINYLEYTYQNNLINIVQCRLVKVSS